MIFRYNIYERECLAEAGRFIAQYGGYYYENSNIRQYVGIQREDGKNYFTVYISDEPLQSVAGYWIYCFDFHQENSQRNKSPEQIYRLREKRALEVLEKIVLL